MNLLDLGQLAYRRAWEEQERVHASVVAGGEEAILLVEHPPVITMGRRGETLGVTNLRASDEALAERGVEFVQTDRGGDITFHGPGQLVVYPIVRLIDHKLSVGGYVRTLQDAVIDAVARGLARSRDAGGRLFILGVGGSAGHASHAVNDFRKLCAFEAYAPTDNVSELTARINDEGWDTSFSEWLKISRLSATDAVLVFSVGGGSKEKNVSMNLVRALEHASERGAKIFGIVGKDGGHTAKVAEACVVIPTVSPDRITPHTEGLAAVVWHLLVSHPDLKRAATKWESTR